MGIDNHSPVKSLIEDFQKVESLINSMKSREDRIFIRECLSNIYAADRLTFVLEYLRIWKSSSVVIKLKQKRLKAYARLIRR